jgi:hypothetical protein
MPAKSEKQRRFMGMIYGAKKGHKRLSSGKARRAMQSLTLKQARDFAKKGK